MQRWAGGSEGGRGRKGRGEGKTQIKNTERPGETERSQKKGNNRGNNRGKPRKNQEIPENPGRRRSPGKARVSGVPPAIARRDESGLRSAMRDARPGLERGAPPPPWCRGSRDPAHGPETRLTGRAVSRAFGLVSRGTQGGWTRSPPPPRRCSPPASRPRTAAVRWDGFRLLLASVSFHFPPPRVSVRRLWW